MVLVGLFLAVIWLVEIVIGLVIEFFVVLVELVVTVFE